MSVSHKVVVGVIALACLGVGVAIAEAGHQREPLYSLSLWAEEDYRGGYDPTFGPHVGTKQEVERAALAARKQNPKLGHPDADAVIFACKMQTRYDGLLDASPPLTQAEFKRDCIEY